MFSIACAGVLFMARLCHCFDYGAVHVIFVVVLRRVLVGVRCLCSKRVVSRVLVCHMIVCGMRCLLCVMFVVC